MIKPLGDETVTTLEPLTNANSDIALLLLVNNLYIIGRVRKDDDKNGQTYTLHGAAQVVLQQDANGITMGFSPVGGILAHRGNLTRNHPVETFQKAHVIARIRPVNELETAYVKATSGLVMAPGGSAIDLKNPGGLKM